MGELGRKCFFGKKHFSEKKNFFSPKIFFSRNIISFGTQVEAGSKQIPWLYPE